MLLCVLFIESATNQRFILVERIDCMCWDASIPKVVRKKDTSRAHSGNEVRQ